MRRLQVVLVASVLAIPSGTFAQSASVVSPLRRGLEREAVRLANTAVPASAAPATPRQRNWAGRHPVGIFAGIGAGIGGVVSVILR